MCGRFNLRTSAKEVSDFFGTPTFPEFESLINIAPTDQALIVTVDALNRNPAETDDAASGRNISWVRWGLVPSWLKELKGWAPRINARSETVATNGVFRSAFSSRRCLLPVTGFYEWQEVEPKKKQPFHIEPATQPFLALAGIWDHWAVGDQFVFSCSILTCVPNKTMDAVHDRMPVVLNQKDWDRWLDRDSKNAELVDLLVPCPEDWLKVSPIASTINNARNKSADALQPLAF